MTTLALLNIDDVEKRKKPLLRERTPLGSNPAAASVTPDVNTS
jgi:hypothetical protein